MITIADHVFPTIRAAKEYLSGKMTTYNVGRSIPDGDAALWFAVLQKHEWFDEYVAHGIDHFSIARSEQRPNLFNMVVVNANGETKPFSYQKYLSGEPLPRLKKILAAMRSEIATQIDTVARKGMHVHHAGKPFVQIADEWLTQNAARWSEMETESAGATGYKFQGRAIAADWQAFHAANATLEIISAEENLSLGAGGYQMRFVPPLPPPPY
jgi:hypothetical protein